MKNADKPINPINYINPEGYPVRSNGLTKREYFAGLAMQGILSGTGKVSIENGLFVNEAKVCLCIADELLKQLEG
jgi:hypothetical protein